MENSKSNYFNGLHGLRAIAAISILISHVSQPEYSNFSTSILKIKTGFDGVTLFFVLSGFLITFLLLNENKKSKIDVKKFYFRRILRIWPLYFLITILGLFILPQFEFMHVPWLQQFFDANWRSNLILFCLMFREIFYKKCLFNLLTNSTNTFLLVI